MIRLSEPFFFGKETKNLKKCIKEKWISAGGKEVDNFQSKMKKFSTGKYNLALINCTAALQLAIKLLGPKQNDEVLVPTITFVATVNSIIYNNCKPVFMDCDDKLLLDKKKFFSFIEKETYLKNGFTYNKKTKKKIISLIVVNTFGNLFNYDEKFTRLCKKSNIKIIEDAAESLGSYYRDNKNFRSVEYSCYSFNGNKLITTGGGGMISTNSKKNFNKALHLSTQAKKDPIMFIHDEVGYNILMSNLHAAIGLAQLENINKVLKKKKFIHNVYKKNLKGINGLKLLEEPYNCSSNFWLNVLEIDKKKYGLSKTQVIRKFLFHNIETRSVWYPNHLQKPFKNFQSYQITTSKKIFDNYLCLPSSFNLNIKDQIKIIKYLKFKFSK